MIYSIYSILAQGQTSKPLPIFCYMKGISIEIGNLRGPVSWPMNHKYCQQSFRNPFFHIHYNEPKKFPVSSIYDLTPYVDQFSCNNREAFPIYLYPHNHIGHSIAKFQSVNPQMKKKLQFAHISLHRLLMLIDNGLIKVAILLEHFFSNS